MNHKLVFTFVALFLIVGNSRGQQTIKILSYNVLYGLKDSTNIDRYKKFVANLDPDIVATQEMNGWTQKTLEGLASSYAHPYALQSKEEGFPVALSSKTPLVNFKKVTENIWHAYIYAKVKDIHIFVIHLSPFSYAKRLQEIDNIIAQIKELPQSEPILVMGDFNSLSKADSPQYGDQVLEEMLKAEEQHNHIRNLNNGQIDYSVLAELEEMGFKDSHYLQHKQFVSSVPTFKDGNGNIKKTNSGLPKRIDYVWCNATAGSYVIKSEVVKNELSDIISDHYPIYIELLIPSNR